MSAPLEFTPHSLLQMSESPELNSQRFSFSILNDTLPRLWNLRVLNALWARALLLCLVASLCALRAYVGLTGTQMFSHDAFALLDGAWRMLNGQRLHLDVFSALGPVAYFPTAVGLLMSKGLVSGFGYGQAMFGFAASCWAYLLTRHRLADVPASLFVLSIALLCTSPFGLGWSPLIVTPLTTYNRFGYALLALLLLEAFCGVGSNYRLSEALGGFSTGAILVTVCFLKISLVFGAAVLLAGCLLFRIPNSRRLLGIATGAASSFLLFLTYFRFNLKPMLMDLRIVGAAKHVDVRRYLGAQIFQEILLVLAFSFVAAAVLSSRSVSRARAIIVAGFSVCLAGLILIFANYEQVGFPLASLFAILVANTVLLGDDKQASVPTLGKAAVLVFASALIVASLSAGLVGTAYGTAQKWWIRSSHWTSRHQERMNGPILKEFLPIGSERDYLDFVNDGLTLADTYRRPGETIMSLDFTNFFSYGLGLPPAKGGATFLHQNSDLNESHHPTPEWLLGNACLVMEPKAASEPALEVITDRIYGPYLHTHFHFIGESPQWRMYRKN